MAQLRLSLLGPFQAKLDGEPISSFESYKVRGLLAYLAVETTKPHGREGLAEEFWPDKPTGIALKNLRSALANLRLAIGDRCSTPPYLLISREMIQFNVASDYWLDAAVFEQSITDALSGRQLYGGDSDQLSDLLETATALYRGNFLEGLSVKRGRPFEEWMLLKQERFNRLMITALNRLAAVYEVRGDYCQVRDLARQQIELEPWYEEAHRQLMRALALGGQRGAALAQYEVCRRLLLEDLGVEPTQESQELYGLIRDGLLNAEGRLANRFSGSEYEHCESHPVQVVTASSTNVDRSTSAQFVARDSELARLHDFLTTAVAGRGQVVLLTGEVGSGKTELMREFARQASAKHSELAVAASKCDPHVSNGDRCQPLREIMHMLTGDVEAQHANGLLTPTHIHRLAVALPMTMWALLDQGPDLVNSFLSRSILEARAVLLAPTRAPWRSRLEALDRSEISTGSSKMALFEQLVSVFRALACQQPLLLLLDDLQWADAESIDFLFHLGRRLMGSRIMILGAYRPGEVALGRPSTGQEWERHPLEHFANEFQRSFGDILIDLDRAGGFPFVKALIDSEPNRLGVQFRQALADHTEGHALFTVELLRNLQERGVMAQDKNGRWQVVYPLEWDQLPTRVEATIAERIDRLPPAWRRVLAAASVEGERFHVEVLAQVTSVDEDELVRLLSGPLSRQHRLVKAQPFKQQNGRRLFGYRFRHSLFQKYLYDSLDAVERPWLHKAVGKALETLYWDSPNRSAPGIQAQLTFHFKEAGLESIPKLVTEQA